MCASIVRTNLKLFDDTTKHREDRIMTAVSSSQVIGERRNDFNLSIGSNNNNNDPASSKSGRS